MGNVVQFLIQATPCEPVRPAGYLGILPSMLGTNATDRRFGLKRVAAKHGEHISVSGLEIKTSLSQ